MTKIFLRTTFLVMLLFIAAYLYSVSRVPVTHVNSETVLDSIYISDKKIELGKTTVADLGKEYNVMIINDPKGDYLELFKNDRPIAFIYVKDYDKIKHSRIAQNDTLTNALLNAPINYMRFAAFYLPEEEGSINNLTIHNNRKDLIKEYGPPDKTQTIKTAGTNDLIEYTYFLSGNNQMKYTCNAPIRQITKIGWMEIGEIEETGA